MQALNELSHHVREFLKSDFSGHDFYHVQRVCNIALNLQEKEGQGDAYVIGAAALVHDLCRPWEKETGKSHFGPEALEIIREVLIQSNIEQDKIEPILEIVALHDIYDWSNKTQKSIELQIVQDADRLDAIGAIGIGRTFAFGGSHDRPMYHPGESLVFEKDFIEDPNYRTTTIAHFYDKLLKLHKNMNTVSGQAMAEERHQFMESFLAQFFDEWAGKK